MIVLVVTTVSQAALGQSLERIGVFETGASKEEVNRAGVQMEFSPDGRFLAVRPRDKSVIVVWDVRAKKKVGTLETEERLGHDAPAISSEPLRIAIACGDEGFRFWDFDAASDSFRETEKAGPSLYSEGWMSFSRDGERLGSVGSDFALIGVDHRKVLHEFAPRVDVFMRSPRNQMSPDLRLFAATNFQDVDLYDTETGKLRGSLLDHGGFVDTVAFRPDGKVLAVGAGRSDIRPEKLVSEIKLWDVARFKEIATTKEFPGRIDAVIHPHEDVLLTLWSAELDSPAAFKIYDVRIGRWTTALSLDTSINSMQVTLCPAGVLAMVRDNSIEVWRLVLPK
jgi:WD40 repeat protein